MFRISPSPAGADRRPGVPHGVQAGGGGRDRGITPQLLERLGAFGAYLEPLWERSPARCIELGRQLKRSSGAELEIFQRSIGPPDATPERDIELHRSGDGAVVASIPIGVEVIARLRGTEPSALERALAGVLDQA